MQEKTNRLTKYGTCKFFNCRVVAFLGLSLFVFLVVDSSMLGKPMKRAKIARSQRSETEKCSSFPYGDPRKKNLNRELHKAIRRSDHRFMGVFAGWESIPGLERPMFDTYFTGYGSRDIYVGSDVMTQSAGKVRDVAYSYALKYNRRLLAFLKKQAFTKYMNEVKPLTLERSRRADPVQDFNLSVKIRDFRFVDVYGADTYRLPGVSRDNRLRYLGQFESLRGLKFIDTTNYIEKGNGSFTMKPSPYYKQAIHYATTYNHLLLNYLRKQDAARR